MTAYRPTGNHWFNSSGNCHLVSSSLHGTTWRNQILVADSRSCSTLVPLLGIFMFSGATKSAWRNNLLWLQALVVLLDLQIYLMLWEITGGFYCAMPFLWASKHSQSTLIKVQAQHTALIQENPHMALRCDHGYQMIWINALIRVLPVQFTVSRYI